MMNHLPCAVAGEASRQTQCVSMRVREASRQTQCVSIARPRENCQTRGRLSAFYWRRDRDPLTLKACHQHSSMQQECNRRIHFYTVRVQLECSALGANTRHAYTCTSCTRSIVITYACVCLCNMCVCARARACACMCHVRFDEDVGGDALALLPAVIFAFQDTCTHIRIR